MIMKLLCERLSILEMLFSFALLPHMAALPVTFFFGNMDQLTPTIPQRLYLALIVKMELVFVFEKDGIAESVVRIFTASQAELSRVFVVTVQWMGSPL